MSNDIFTDKHDKEGSPAGHRARVRKRIMDNGFESLQDYEKIEAVLFNVISRSDTKPLAIRLIDKFGSFSRVLDASFDELKSVDGCGDMAAYYLNLLAMISKAYLRSDNNRPFKFDNFSEIGDYVVKKFIGEKNENLLVICLNDKNEFMGEGVIVSQDSYEIGVKLKLISEHIHKYNASRIILAHNHPEGVLYPSTNDLGLNNEIKEFFGRINVELVEHYIVSGNEYRKIINY